MINIPITLSTESIHQAIVRLRQAEENLRWGASETVDTLISDGADVAQDAYGGMAVATPLMEGESEGKIVVSGDAAVIAEFGAGYATMENHPLAKNAPVDVRVGSYSEQNDGMFYWSDLANPGEGYWFFGGQEYDRVEPRHGLLNAREYIQTHCTEIAKELIRL